MLVSIVYSGNGYLPLNSEWPADRIKFIIAQARLQACIVQDKFLDFFEAILVQVGLNFLKEELQPRYFIYKIEQAQVKFPSDLSYVLFTSGSTGFPKGIVHSSGSLSAFLKWCEREFKTYECKRFVSIAPLNFDLSVFDVFYPLLNGGTLYLPSQTTLSNTRLFVPYLVKYKIEALYTTPSYLKLLLTTGHLHKYDLRFVKLVLLAGEPLHYDLINDLKLHFKKAVFYNLYGPTETNVCTYYKITEGKFKPEESVPIGKPCYPNEIKVSREGELVYKGQLLMKALIDENGLTKTKSPYKTGDLVKKVKGGKLEFVGRKDEMVKRNGFRIEPEEIRRALLQLRGITRCEVLCVKKGSWNIVAFVCDTEALGELKLKSFCLEKLPAYMLPDRIISLKEMPLNINHKADLNKLKEMII